MPTSLRLPYTSAGNTPGISMPRLPVTLSYENRSINVVGLLDTGSTVNILPYGIGVALGALGSPNNIGSVSGSALDALRRVYYL